ncbi:TldD/PmbA family protein [Acidilutibacter cellobiosedens]|jgi:TldD protein|uniref:TldD/PmbA family protein n=1 Tax=Acidilutibacter cellobiosedens TaxID=2507161 RepID=A0A410QBI4_9FIRM|nr:TldD/PmbA family protein [Acidilutibacter cellobiosedens]QAT61228.1 TldD/PmbA family protein [Acidilutibacter cellobiosedens]
MEKVKMSEFLTDKKTKLEELLDMLLKDYKYVSILGTDVKGKTYSVKKTGVDIGDSMWTERGFVIRVFNGINYSEYSFNELPEDLSPIVEKIRGISKEDLNKLKSSSLEFMEYPLIQEENAEKSFLGEVEILPEKMSSREKVERLQRIKDEGFKYSDELVDCRVSYEEVHVSKIFLSRNKKLAQSYIWTNGQLVAIVRRNGNTKFDYKGYSGLKGVEILNEMNEGVKGLIDETIELLDSEKVQPGEYDVICTPEISGLIAHEAFGHGVEMDMFVKNRAKAVEYLKKPVASELVTMHDGAASAVEVSSYLFDDEGVIGSDTTIIDKGILKTGISDLLSALKLGTKPTGNGKRESFERKAYARMTNTFFEKRSSKLEDMVSSIDYGYLIDVGMSGMEDPKNWGIQCMVLIGREIRNGKFTGKIVSPIVLTGYVPDLLQSISMVSDKVELSGTGMCGKGYREFVKVSDGGPYIKAKVRLG